MFIAKFSRQMKNGLRPAVGAYESAKDSAYKSALQSVRMNQHKILVLIHYV